jgi:serine/threonine-protein kinase HipA
VRCAQILMHGQLAGTLEEIEQGKRYQFRYSKEYQGEPISLTMPVEATTYEFDRFPPFFDGLLPEGPMLDGLLRQNKIDAHDLFSQLVAVGQELVGAVTVKK